MEKLYRVVKMGAGGRMVKLEFDSRELLLAEFPQFTAESSKVRRAELRGEPVLVGLLGPMYDGTTPDGRPVVRYEDSASYAALSR